MIRQELLSHFCKHIVILSCFIVAFVSCSTTKSDDCPYITVFYYSGHFEPSLPLTYSKLVEAEKNSIITDTIVIRPSLYHSIKDNMRSTTVLSTDAKWLDTRVLIQLDSICVCISIFNDVVSSDSTQVSFSSKDIYEIKKATGYYNTFNIQELQFDSLIQQYGIPDNYQISNEDVKSYRKIIVKRGNE